MNYAGNTAILMITKTICVLLCFQSSLCAKHFIFDEGYFYSGSFQKYSRTYVQNSRTSQGYPTIFQFPRTFQGHHAFSRTFQGPCEPWRRSGLIKQRPSSNVQLTVSYISLSSVYTTTAWKCLMSRFVENVKKRTRYFLFLSKLRYGS